MTQRTGYRAFTIENTALSSSITRSARSAGRLNCTPTNATSSRCGPA
jgi:hypothetical protein